MSRQEARSRIDAATKTLRNIGWTEHQIENALNGLHREDAVEQAERLAAGSGDETNA